MGRFIAGDASYFERPGRSDFDFEDGSRHGRSTCAWRGCLGRVALDTPVCHGHAAVISSRVFNPPGPRDDAPKPEPIRAGTHRRVSRGYVYYLMQSPTVVKIGTTIRLADRMNQLRTELQYVVAVERGYLKLERERHLQFAAERVGRREDFRLSPALVAHIDSLAPFRDELVNEATTPPYGIRTIEEGDTQSLIGEDWYYL